MDELEDFFVECCIFKPGATVTMAELREAYDRWAEESGIRATLDAKVFNRRLRSRGCTDSPTHIAGRSVRCWKGIGLRSSRDEPPTDSSTSDEPPTDDHVPPAPAPTSGAHVPPDPASTCDAQPAATDATAATAKPVTLSHEENIERVTESPIATRSTVAAAAGTPAYESIANPRRLAELLPDLLQAACLGFDIETTGLDSRTERARLVQLAVSAEHVVLIDLNAVPFMDVAPLLAPGGPLLVGHNLKFDLQFCAAAGLPVPDGRQLFDTMLASQLLHAGLPTPKGTHTLAAVAERYLGRTLDKSQQTSDWSGALTTDQLRYAAVDAAIVLPLANHLQVALEAAGLAEVMALECRALPAIVSLEFSGMPIDAEAWQALAVDAEAEAGRLLGELNQLAGRPVNWRSPPQVLAVLRERGHAPTDTSEPSLRCLAASEPLAALLLAHRSASKRESTYGQQWLREHVHPDTRRVHANFWQLGAATGRMSCSSPNLQNIPRDAAYRSCFRPASDRVLVKADYSQIELRIAADISGDAALIRAYTEGADVHVRTAASVLGGPETAVTLEQRQLAKALNFGLLYGMGAVRLREYAGTSYGVQLTDTEARTFRDRWFETYSGIGRWHRGQRDESVATRTLMGRRRLAVAGFTDKLNTPVQGTGADILKLALARLHEDRMAFPTAVPVVVVHDEIVFECDTQQADDIGAWLRRHMEAAAAEIMPRVPVVADVTVCVDWSGTPRTDSLKPASRP